MTSLETQKDTKRSWWIVEFEVDSSQEDMASWLMIQQGANGCQFVESSKGQVTLQASFEAEKIDPENLSPLYAALDEYGLNSISKNLRLQMLQEEDWLCKWKQGLKPILLGDKFLVSPPWFKDELAVSDNSGRHLIWIEPGLAFGTGFHFTTQFCLRAIEKHLSANAGKNASELELLDVGTGSGILAIAALLLLPEANMTAIETDPVACKIAAENFELNKINKRVKLLEGSTEKVLGHKYAAILSNLTCEDNIALLPEYTELSAKGSKIIMSGILKEKLHLIEAELQKFPFALIDKETENTWAGLVLERLS